ncbi:MAG: type IX secretion system outer membrane channel protein PorV [Flavobacteriaceae bacterium]|nr:type IX secretion system outer membrane channel protein PorV [Flavobacteriaceae bacterium]
MKIFGSSILLLFVLTTFSFVRGQERVITTGVPFLLITPDARAAGMGELGVATSPDSYAQQWNPAKYAFSESNSGLGLSYTPYLRQLVDDIFLGSLTYYNKLNDRSAWASSLKYFSYGNVQFNNMMSGTIIDQGSKRPNEITLDLSYSLKLSEKFSMAVAGRFLRSDLKIHTDIDATSANSLGVDIAGFYQGSPFGLGNNDARFRGGFNISNIGPRLKYDEGGQMDFIPTNLKIGSGMDLIFDSSNILGIHLEFSKLLVPTPVAFYDNNNQQLGYRQPDVNFFNGIFKSFNDAPGGFDEELKEITWALGLEYLFANTLALRSGYFNESEEKGSRRYLTFGAGFKLKSMEIDISYLSSTSKIRNPLENTLRFSLSFNFDGANRSARGQELSLVY